MERFTHGPAGRTRRSRRLHSAVLATRSDHRHSASLAHQRRSRPLRPGARATVPATRSRFRHQRRSRTRARIAPAAVAFSHQVLLPPAVAIRDLSLRPAEPHLQRLGRQATLPPPVHLARGPGPVPLSPSKRLHAPTREFRWPVRAEAGHASSATRQSARQPQGGEGGRPLDQLSRSVTTATALLTGGPLDRQVQHHASVRQSAGARVSEDARSMALSVSQRRPDP